MIGVMEQSVIISFSLPAGLLVGLGHAAKAAGRTPADHLRAILRLTIPALPPMAGPGVAPASPPCDEDGEITARVLARLRDAEEPAPPPLAEPVGDRAEGDHVFDLVRAICATATPAARSAPEPAAPDVSPDLAADHADPAGQFGPMTYGILAARGEVKAPVAGGEAEAEEVAAGLMAFAEAEATLADAEPVGFLAKDPAAAVPPTGVVPVPALLAPAPAAPTPEAPTPDLPSADDLRRIIRAAPGWLDLQRSLRREGLVLRLSDCGQTLLVNNWPEDRPLMPIEALGLSLEGLCLHFRAPFPGGGGLAHVLRALVAEDRGPERAA